MRQTTIKTFFVVLCLSCPLQSLNKYLNNLSAYQNQRSSFVYFQRLLFWGFDMKRGLFLLHRGFHFLVSSNENIFQTQFSQNSGSCNRPFAWFLLALYKGKTMFFRSMCNVVFLILIISSFSLFMCFQNKQSIKQ